MRRHFHMGGFGATCKTAMGIAVFFILLTASAATVRAGYYFRYDEDARGKVIDADTRQPIAGVVVMALWVTQHTRITIEPEERYYDYFETLTDAKGEFTIPGKGRNIFRNMPPPKIHIYKAGYSIRDVRFRVTGYPKDLKVVLKDGERIIFYQKLPLATRKEYVKHYRPVPYYEMAGKAVSRNRYRLYSAELAKDRQALGIRRRQSGTPFLIFKKGGAYPAANQPVEPRKSQPNAPD